MENLKNKNSEKLKTTSIIAENRAQKMDSCLNSHKPDRPTNMHVIFKNAYKNARVSEKS